jgi:hypothetical protein
MKGKKMLSQQNSSKKKIALFAAITLIGTLFFLELFASWALMLRMRLAKTEDFTRSEPTYLSLLNIPYKAGLKFGFSDRTAESGFGYRITKEPKPQFGPDPELGYKPFPGKYQVTFSRRTFDSSKWERLRVKEKLFNPMVLVGPVTANHPAVLTYTFLAAVTFMDWVSTTSRRLLFYCSKQGKTCV